MEADLDFRLLGPLEVFERDQPLALGGRRNRTLLALFLLSPNQVLSVDRLSEDLWSGHPPDTAGAAIRVHVTNLRRSLKLSTANRSTGPSLVARRPGYVMQVELDHIDAHRFERLVERGRSAVTGSPAQAATMLAQALAMWHGPALLEVRDQSFAREEVVRLEELRIEATEHRIDAELLSGKHAEVISDLEVLTLKHPLRERLAGQLMLALYRSGRQGEALRTYSHLRSALVEELGLEPSRDLQELEQAILLQRHELDAGLNWLSFSPSTNRPVQVRVPEPLPGSLRVACQGPIAGRSQELAALRDAWLAATASQSQPGLRTIVVQGSAGIGKSRLVAEFGSSVHQEGAQILFGRCDEVPLVPYQPFVEAFGEQVQRSADETFLRRVGPWGSELFELLPELGRLMPWLEPRRLHEPRGDRLRLFDAIARLLEAIAGAKPTLLIIEDLHLTDDVTALLLQYLARAASPMPLLVILTLRDSSAQPRPLDNALAMLSREARGRTLHLEGLDIAAVRLLLDNHVADAVSDRSARQLREITEGNPLFILELTEELSKSGELQEFERSPRLTPLPVPKTVLHIIRGHLDRLNRKTRHVLEQAAVIGHRFNMSLLSQVSGTGDEVLLDVLDNGVDVGVLDETLDSFDDYVFTHTLFREALFAGLTSNRRVRVHGKIARTIEASGVTEDNLSEVAYHFCAAAAAGLAPQATEYACRAADRDMHLLAFEEAAANYARARAAAALASKPDAAETGRLLIAEGEARANAGDPEGARQLLREAADLGRRVEDVSLLCEAALAFESTTWVGHGFIVEGNVEEAENLTREALDKLGDQNPSLKVELLARVPRITYFTSSPHERQVVAEQAVRQANELGAPDLRAAAQEGLRWATWGPDDLDLQSEVSLEIARIGRHSNNAAMEFRGHVWSFLAALDRGHMDDVDIEVARMTELRDRLGDPMSRWYPAACRSMRELLAGDFESAESSAIAALEIAQRFELHWAVANCGIQLFVLRRDQGRLGEIQSTASSMAQEYPTIPAFRCGLAQVQCATGRTDEARCHFDALSAHGFSELPRDFGWLVALHELTEVCHALDDRDRAGTLYQLLAPYSGRNLVYGPGAACGGSTSRNLGVLAGMIGKWDTASDHFSKAAEFNRRLGAEPWLARTECDHAEMLRARARPGDRRRVRELARRAASRADRIGLVPVSARAHELLKTPS